MMVPQGSRIDLVIGDGLGNTEFNVPDVVGLTYDEASSMLNGSGLTITAIWEGDIADSAMAIVYVQYPSAINEVNAPNRIKQGDVVDIRIKQNPTPEELQHNKAETKSVNTDKSTGTGTNTQTPDDYQ
jgi:beta-lactam-binding protein with PASTA domain